MAFFRKPFDAVINCETDEQANDDEFVSKQLLRSLTLNRLEADKPSVILITGDSGEGKSKTAIRVAHEILTMQGINIREYMDDIIVYNPFEFMNKVKAILTEERLKHINVFILDEARGIVGANSWNSFINQAIATVNAVSRGVKPLVIIIISQDVGDIDRSTRKTIRYEFICSRPLHDRVRIRPVIYYKYRARGSVEKMELRYRDMQVDVRAPTVSNSWSPPILIVKQLEDDIWQIYKSQEKERKIKLIENKTNQMVSRLKKEWAGDESRVDKVYNALLENGDKLNEITILRYGRRRVNPDALEFSDWSKHEIKELETKLKSNRDASVVDIPEKIVGKVV
jgi:DNA replication protein DnaC